ncbi:MAG: proline iminopeptidase, partial [bacterium]
ETMNGPNEFIVIGNLKNWDRTDRLGEISVPTLITVGRYDELTTTCSETLHRGIPNSRTVIFEESAHLAHLEEPDKYRQVVADFMVEFEPPRH